MTDPALTAAIQAEMQQQGCYLYEWLSRDGRKAALYCRAHDDRPVTRRGECTVVASAVRAGWSAVRAGMTEEIDCWTTGPGGPDTWAPFGLPGGCVAWGGSHGPRCRSRTVGPWHTAKESSDD